MIKRVLLVVTLILLLLSTFSVAYADKPVKFDPEGNELGW